MITSGITREELVQWGGADVFNQALALCNSGDVHDVVYNDDTLEVSGKIEQPSGWDMPVKFKLEAGGRIHSECPCITNQKYGQACPHVVAIGLALTVLEMTDDDVADAGNSRKDDDSAQHPPSQPEANYIEVPVTPKFYALVSGSRAALSIELDAYYGDIDFPACSVQPERVVYLEDPDDDLIRRVRSMKAERDAVKALGRAGFVARDRDRDLTLSITSPQKGLNFLGAGLPAIRRKGWRVDLSERLMALTDTMPSVVPVVEIKDASRGDFDVKITFDAMGHEVSPFEVQAAINRGDGYIMKDGAVVLLDNTARKAGSASRASTGPTSSPPWISSTASKSRTPPQNTGGRRPKSATTAIRTHGSSRSPSVRSTRRSAPTRSRASTGCDSSRRPDSADSSPTRWASAKHYRP